MHIESVLEGVVGEDRCACERKSVFGSLFGGKKKECSTAEGK